MSSWKNSAGLSGPTRWSESPAPSRRLPQSRLKCRDYDSSRVHGYVLSRDEVSAIAKRFGELPLAERKKIPGLVEARADVIFAGSVILERVMKRFDVGHVIVSDQGVRWGLVWRELDRSSSHPATDTPIQTSSETSNRTG